jgi:hypothetical protein
MPPGKYAINLIYKQPPKEVEEVVDEAATIQTDNIDAVRFNGSHLNIENYIELQQLVGSQSPLVTDLYLKHRLITTIKDEAVGDGVFAAIWGGLYYDFRGIKLAKDVLGKDTKATDLDLFLETLGIGNIKGGINAEQFFDKLPSDRAIIMKRSLVTGKIREALMFKTPSAGDDEAMGSITGDIKDKDVDIRARAYKNILAPTRRAREAIFRGTNGCQVFGLFNEQGARQDEVPPDIANDSTIPSPHTKRLQIRGCIICHCIDGSNGWKPVINEIKTITSFGIDIFDDASQVGKLTQETVNRIYGKYNGNFDKSLMRARMDTAECFLRCTGPWKGGDGTQADVCKLAATQLQRELDSYIYGDVGAKEALAMEGWDVPEKSAASIFRRLHPPEIKAAAFGIIPEDPTIAALKVGQRVPMTDWLLSYDFAMARQLKAPFRQVLISVAKKEHP